MDILLSSISDLLTVSNFNTNLLFLPKSLSSIVKNGRTSEELEESIENRGPCESKVDTDLYNCLLGGDCTPENGCNGCVEESLAALARCQSSGK